MLTGPRCRFCGSTAGELVLDLGHQPPSEYFRDNWYATFWFEENQGDVQGLLDRVGEDRVLFETDFPPPTCLYPSPLETVAEKMGTLRPETRRRVMGENAARLYRV